MYKKNTYTAPQWRWSKIEVKKHLSILKKRKKEIIKINNLKKGFFDESILDRIDDTIALLNN